MSQSPIDDFSEQATVRYKQGWRALNRLLHEDRSFSGNERNCAFLNTGGDTASFADVSAVTGFDFADDGRGLATADWDFDGDLDVWVTNRTAPRVRLLTNNSATAGRFIALKLRGDGIITNRDAIGARLELHLSGTEKPVRIRTLHAGEGFLSQSSAWIHFGLGDASGIEKLVVKWPGAAAQEITNLDPGKFYHITQNSPTATQFVPPAKRAPLTAAEQIALPATETARVIVAAGLPVPEIKVVDANGDESPLQLSTTRPTVINIWSSTCLPCIAELTDWAQHRDKLLAAGIDIVTLSTDHLSPNPHQASTLAALAKTGSTFPNKAISAASLGSIDDLQKSVLDRWIPLPVPSTLIVSQSGELVAIYKGPVSTQQLIRDIPLALAPAEVRRAAAIPFAGQWVGAPTPADPLRTASMMLDHDRFDSAIDYLKHCASVFEPMATDDNGRRQLGDIYYMLGLLTGINNDKTQAAIDALTLARDLIPSDLRIRLELGRKLLAQGKPQDALVEFTAATQINPSDVSLRLDLALLHFRLGQYPQSQKIFKGIVAAYPKNSVAQYHLANAEVRVGNLPAAIDGYRKTLSANPQLIDAANNLAWILASHPDEKLRSADEAVALTQRLCQITKEKQPQFLDTYSVALANAGKFPQAIEAANKSIALYPPENKATTDPIRARIKLYEAGQPYRESNWLSEER